MRIHLSALAILIGLTGPVAAEDKPSAAEAGAEASKREQSLKTSPDELPEGIRRFNGMLVGRLAAKDVERGTFVVRVDAVSRVWRNSAAKQPRSVVGKTIEVGGVSGKFLDVLVVTRIGETLEFECKHDGDRLVFPGELLRKVAPYDPSDYPVLPESFRGFRGVARATIVKKDPETYELIVKVDRVLDTWKDNAAERPESIEGKTMMLAGFWNRKESYHDLKIGETVEVGMRHIAVRSDHLNVAEILRGAPADPKKERPNEKSSGGASGITGFRGMLVGRLVEKDVERGTFTVKVDAVPRVWNNNRAADPKSLIGTPVAAEGVSGRMLDALVVTRVGETIEFGALHEEGPRVRVGEVLRKVAPVQPGDYPVLPDGFRGFRGMLVGKVVKKGDHLLELVVEVSAVEREFPGSRGRESRSILGKRLMLAGFWRRKDDFHRIKVGDTIEFGVEHQQLLSDHVNVIESIRQLDGE